MKYLFYIHSHITNLVAKQIVTEKQLPVVDCLFLLARNYKSDFENSIELPYTHYPVDSFGVEVLFWKNWAKINELDQWVKNKTDNQDYIFYTPQSGFNFFYLVVNHPKCKGFAYLEEGLCSYLEEKELRNPKKEFWLRDKWYELNYKGRSKSVKHFYDLKHTKYLGCFGISEYAFPGLPKKNKLNVPFVVKNSKEHYEHVVILGQYVEYGEMTQSTLIKVMDDLFQCLVEKGIKRIHLKFHPVQEEEQSIKPIKKIIKKYDTQITVDLLGQNVVLENIAFSTDANFYIVSSSVGIYASIAGNKVYCLAKKVAALEPVFQKKIDSFPGFFQAELDYDIC
ncbi:MAG: polysialyltransferase family glycosyltransferase [Saprospiraceae bacterium]